MGVVTVVVGYALFRGLRSCCCPAPALGHRGLLRRRAGLRPGRGRSPSPPSTRSAAPPTSRSARSHRHGRRARADRHRRGRHHRADRRRVIAVRPDLVHGARGSDRPAQAARRRRAGRRGAGRRARPAAAGSPRKLWVGGLVTALVLAGFVSFYASASPDGLEKVAADKGIDSKARTTPPPTPRSPTTASRTSPTPGSPAASPACVGAPSPSLGGRSVAAAPPSAADPVRHAEAT